MTAGVAISSDPSGRQLQLGRRGVAGDLSCAAAGRDRITAPTLIFHGIEDGDVPFDDGVYASRRIPGAQHYCYGAQEIPQK